MKFSEFIEKYAKHPHYQAPTGNVLHARTWQTEAPLRMLLNNLNPQVAENPADLIVYGGTGQAARNPEALREIIRILLTLGEDESLLVQSGKPVGVVRTHPEAPRVMIANSNLVPAWANWDTFENLKARGLTMYGQMTAGSWIYIGSQGILQGTYETFAECGRKYFDGKTRGKLIVSGGLGGMGGAQPLAATLAGYTFLGVDVDPERIRKRLETKYIDKMTDSFEEARQLVQSAQKDGVPLSVGLVGNIGDVLNRMLEEGWIPEVVTDQTSAHDPLNGYVPAGISFMEAMALRKSDSVKYRELSLKSMARDRKSVV